MEGLLEELDGEVIENILRAHTLGGEPPWARRVPFRNIGELLREQCGNRADEPWLIFYPDAGSRSAYTYREFYERVLALARLLRAMNIRRGDRIATISYNHADTVVQYFAAWLTGAVVVPVNTGEDDKRISFILDHAQVRLAFVRQEFVERIENIALAMPELTILPVDPAHPVPEVPPGAEGQVPETVGPDDDALIVYTSGTTGMPKGVVLSHYNLLVDARAIADWHGMTPGQRMMCVLPIHHVNGITVTLMTPMMYGGSVVLNQKFSSPKFFALIEREHVHVVSVVPTLLQFLLHEKDLSRPAPGSFRHIICGAGPLTCELAANFEQRFGIPIIHGYGLSETTCYSCFLPLDLEPAEHERWLSAYGYPSIGVAIPANEMTIHDDRGSELEEGTKGEIVIRGHNVMREYYANPEANAQTFAFGWFRSGDEGFYRRDERGRKFFFITGRIKELIIRGGVNISPFEIDEVLMNIPGVKAGLAVGFDNDWYGEEIGAYVQCAQGRALTEEEVLAKCRSAFPFSKCPKVVLFGNDVPVTSTGKYQRNKLRPLFEKWKKVQFREGPPRRGRTRRKSPS